jgi:transcriptional regulator with XRE-family HTH domain
MTICEKIKALRLKAGMSQTELSRRTGIPQAAISVYESKTKSPTALKLSALAKGLGVSIEELIDGIATPMPAPEDIHIVHGNSTEAQLHKAIQQLELEDQRALLRQAKLILEARKAITEASQPQPVTQQKRRTKAA